MAVALTLEKPIVWVHASGSSLAPPNDWVHDPPSYQTATVSTHHLKRLPVVLQVRRLPLKDQPPHSGEWKVIATISSQPIQNTGAFSAPILGFQASICLWQNMKLEDLAFDSMSSTLVPRESFEALVQVSRCRPACDLF